jgi:hypothetical protein
MKSPLVLALAGAAVCCPLIAQDAMQYGLKFQNVMAENDKVRVVHYVVQLPRGLLFSIEAIAAVRG